MAQFTNQAQLSYNGTIVNSNVVTGEVLETLSVTKTAVMDDYTRGDDVTYVVSLVNSGVLPFTGLTLTDDLGGYEFGGETVYPLDYTDGSVRVYVNGVLQAASPAVVAGPPLVISGLTVPANGNLIIIYEASVTEFAPLDAEGEIINTVTVTGGGAAPLTASETIGTQDEPVLTITKSIDPAVVAENGTITYTFVIQNTGNTAAVATDNVIVTDTFAPALSNISVAFNGTVLTEPADYSYNEQTGEFETAIGTITIDAAEFEQDESGAWIITPGVGVLTVTGTI